MSFEKSTTELLLWLEILALMVFLQRLIGL